MIGAISRRVGRFVSALVCFVSLAASAQFLTVTNPPARVQLAWDQSPEPTVIGYKIYWGNAVRAYTNVIDVPGRSTTTGFVTNLAWSTTYHFAATAYNAIGLESLFSDEAVWKSPDPPPSPTNLNATNAMIKVAVEISPTPSGPWSEYATLLETTTTPGFYRSLVSITPPKIVVQKRLLLSPKHQAL